MFSEISSAASSGLVAFKLLGIVGIPLTIALGYVAFSMIRQDLPEEDRFYMDPLPGGIKMVWPLVQFFSFYVASRLGVETLEKYNKNLHKAGMGYLMTPEQYVGLKLTGTLLMGLIAFLCVWMLGERNYLVMIGGGALGYFLPTLSLRDMKGQREKAIIRALPTYLDFLTMAVQTGLNMAGAIQQAIEKGPDGPLKVEFGKVIRDIKAGMPRIDAMKMMADRLDMPAVNTFVSAVVQAERTGASVGDTLRAQSDQRRTERFQYAEKLAMQAPVKLIFPLVAFIFPTTFLILGFPIAVKLWEAFGQQ